MTVEGYGGARDAAEEVRQRVASNAPGDPTSNGKPASNGSRELRLLTIAEIREQVALLGERPWLVKGLWPGDAYGVLGAQDKAGKTWALLDLAVSVAAGRPWFGRFDCPNPGTVALFLGEGGMPGMMRRLDAVCAHKGVKLDDLPIVVDFKVPNLSREAHLTMLTEQLGRHTPRLVGIDPLYLSVGGKTGASLSEMGEVLSGPQTICAELAAALVVMSHWTKRGEGNGPERFTGVGPGAWGRVLGSAAVDQSDTDQDGRTDVVLSWEFKGGEIPDIAFATRRRVWADDPNDLNSPLNYETEITRDGPAIGTTGRGSGPMLGFGKRRILLALASGGPLQSKDAIQDATAHDGQGKPLKDKTVENNLPRMEREGLVEGTDPLPGMERRWTLTPAGRIALGPDAAQSV